MASLHSAAHFSGPQLADVPTVTKDLKPTWGIAMTFWNEGLRAMQCRSAYSVPASLFGTPHRHVGGNNSAACQNGISPYEKSGSGKNRRVMSGI